MKNFSKEKHGVSVEVRGLHKSYDGVEILKGVSLGVSAGEIFVIMGLSGSGKSVLLKHVIGLEIPDKGSVEIDGLRIEENASENYRLAMVFQSGALLNSLTVGENVGLYLTEHRLKPRDEIERIVEDKLRTVGLENASHKYPSELSGGMKKRVAIARALIIEPHLLLYDEPTSELDPVTAVTIGREVLKLRDRIHLTSIVVTHDRSLAFGIADRMAVIDQGEILQIGTPDEIRASDHPVIRELLSADFKPEPTNSL